MLEAARLCDAYGLDSISTGGTLAWAMECAERGLLPEAGDLRFGSAEAVLAVIPAIAERRGVGDLLAEGSRRAALAVGQGSLDWAMQVKGLELPGYEPRSLKTMALGLAVSPRGACHNRSGAYEADFSGAVDRLTSEPGRGALVAASEDFAAALDSLIVCKFLRRCFDDFYGEAADLLAKVTGWDYTRPSCAGPRSGSTPSNAASTSAKAGARRMTDCRRGCSRSPWPRVSPRARASPERSSGR